MCDLSGGITPLQSHWSNSLGLARPTSTEPASAGPAQTKRRHRTIAVAMMRVVFGGLLPSS